MAVVATSEHIRIGELTLFVECDGCYGRTSKPSRILVHVPHDFLAMPVEEQYKLAKTLYSDHGWKILGGYHMCPKCLEEMRRNAEEIEEETEEAEGEADCPDGEEVPALPDEVRPE